MRVSKVEDSIFRVPKKSEFFVVSDVAADNGLHSSLAIFDLNISYANAWFFTYNAMSPSPNTHGQTGIGKSHSIDWLSYGHSACTAWTCLLHQQTAFFVVYLARLSQACKRTGRQRYRWRMHRATVVEAACSVTTHHHHLRSSLGRLSLLHAPAQMSTSPAKPCMAGLDWTGRT